MRLIDVFFPPGDPGVENPLNPAGFEMISGLFGIFAFLVVGGIVVSIIVGMRKWRVLRDAGIDPLTVDARLAATVINSNALRPGEVASANVIESRLAELDDLHARGVISAEERAAARASILSGAD